MFARQQCILCSALRYGCLILLYVASIPDLFCPWNNRARFYQAAASHPWFFAGLPVGNYFILSYFIFTVNYNRKDLIRSGIFPHLTCTFYIQFSFSFKSRKASLRNLSLNQFTLAFQSFLLFFVNIQRHLRQQCGMLCPKTTFQSSKYQHRILLSANICNHPSFCKISQCQVVIPVQQNFLYLLYYYFALTALYSWKIGEKVVFVRIQP